LALEYYVEGVKNGNRRILAKAITLVESSHPTHRATARRLIEALLPFSGRAVRLGITGVPGAGKSTFIESFGSLLTGRGLRVAVLAVDPSSKRSGGSILADKTRMEKLAADPGAFIRPSPSGETSGGVAQKTREAMLLCEAAGFDVIIVETVGVGQCETTVAGMVDFFLVLMITGAGDALQGIKMGVLELATAVAINKADGENIELAERTRQELADALHLMHSTSGGWQPRVVTCSALTLTGLDELWEMIQAHYRYLAESGGLDAHRKQQNLEWMWALLESRLKDRFINCPGVREKIEELEDRILRGDVTCTVASRELFLTYIDESSGNGELSAVSSQPSARDDEKYSADG
jgi:LAO/AO transport system kinase